MVTRIFLLLITFHLLNSYFSLHSFEKSCCIPRADKEPGASQGKPFCVNLPLTSENGLSVVYTILNFLFEKKKKHYSNNMGLYLKRICQNNMLASNLRKFLNPSQIKHVCGINYGHIVTHIPLQSKEKILGLYYACVIFLQQISNLYYRNLVWRKGINSRNIPNLFWEDRNSLIQLD